jgi:hypothetical protein
MRQSDDESCPSATEFPFPPESVFRRGNDDITVEIELCLGDIANTPSKIILLGQMRGLDPTSAAADLDNAMEGNLFHLLEQRNAARGAGCGSSPTMFPVSISTTAAASISPCAPFPNEPETNRNHDHRHPRRTQIPDFQAEPRPPRQARHQPP